jgi:hypothetical protein
MLEFLQGAVEVSSPQVMMAELACAEPLAEVIAPLCMDRERLPMVLGSTIGVAHFEQCATEVVKSEALSLSITELGQNMERALKIHDGLIKLALPKAQFSQGPACGSLSDLVVVRAKSRQSVPHVALGLREPGQLKATGANE